MGLCVLALSLVPSFASADDAVVAQVQQRVQDGLLKPLSEKEKSRSKFSRARLPPHERRVRVTQTSPTVDPSGRAFLAFAVDVRYGEEWHENDIVGCAYPKTGALFVKRGDEFRPAEVLLGTNAEVAAGVCVAAKAKS